MTRIPSTRGATLLLAMIILLLTSGIVLTALELNLQDSRMSHGFGQTRQAMTGAEGGIARGVQILDGRPFRRALGRQCVELIADPDNDRWVNEQPWTLSGTTGEITHLVMINRKYVDLLRAEVNDQTPSNTHCHSEVTALSATQKDLLKTFINGPLAPTHLDPALGGSLRVGEASLPPRTVWEISSIGQSADGVSEIAHVLGKTKIIDTSR